MPYLLSAHRLWLSIHWVNTARAARGLTRRSGTVRSSSPSTVAVRVGVTALKGSMCKHTQCSCLRRPVPGIYWVAAKYVPPITDHNYACRNFFFCGHGNHMWAWAQDRHNWNRNSMWVQPDRHPGLKRRWYSRRLGQRSVTSVTLTYIRNTPNI